MSDPDGAVHWDAAYDQGETTASTLVAGLLVEATHPRSVAIVATFGPDGPQRC